MPNEARRCEACRWWARDNFGRALAGPHCDGSLSECRRNAPVYGGDSSNRTRASRLFPLTAASDWCGEYTPTEQPHAE